MLSRIAKSLYWMRRYYERPTGILRKATIDRLFRPTHKR